MELLITNTLRFFFPIVVFFALFIVPFIIQVKVNQYKLRRIRRIAQGK